MKYETLFSPKQIKSYQESNSRINIWEGAVRSGKTFISLWRFIKELRYGPEGEYAIICRTYDTFKRNTLPLLIDFLGEGDIKHFFGKRELHLFGKVVHIVGADDERAESKIRGATFAGAYVDEATIIPETVFKQLIARCAMNGAKIFATTNPDSPYHWLKRDFLENNPDVKSWQFKMDDNPDLKDEDKQYLRTQYRGLWFQRFIEGKWVQAEGAIYDFFDPVHHVIDFAPPTARYYVVGVDYGTTNPCAFILMGVNRNNLGFHYWVEDEYYFDSKVHQRQKTDSEYAEDLKRFIKDKPIKQIFIDPSAASFKVELQRQGVANLYEAENEVLDGIRKVGDLLNNGTLKICRKCTNLIKEFGSYVWDSKSLTSGVDKPLKQTDHCFAAGTSVLHENGDIPIQDIKENDLVMTSSGWKPVLKTWKRSAEVFEYNVLGIPFFCTNSHKFFTLNRGFIEIENLLKSDCFIVNLDKECLKCMSGEVQSISAIQMLRHLLTETIIADGSRVQGVDFYIEKCGNPLMGKFHQDVIFITRTGIQQTTTLAISSAFYIKATLPIMHKILLQNKSGFLKTVQTLFDIKQLDGTDPKKAENGIVNTEKTSDSSRLGSSNASSVDKAIKQERPTVQDFVRINASQNGVELFSLIVRIENVLNVIKSLEQINSSLESSAEKVVPVRTVGDVDVYNLTVKDQHEFYANGILVSNCLDALRYAIYTSLFAKDSKGMSPMEYERMKADALGGGPELPEVFRDPREYGNPQMPWF